MARNYVHQVLLVEELQQYGAQVEFLERPMRMPRQVGLEVLIAAFISEQATKRLGVLFNNWGRGDYRQLHDPYSA